MAATSAATMEAASAGAGGDDNDVVPSFDCAALRTRQALETRLIEAVSTIYDHEAATRLVLKCLKQLGFPDSVEEPETTIPRVISEALPEWKSLCNEIEACRLETMTQEQRAAERARLEERQELGKATWAACVHDLTAVYQMLFPVEPCRGGLSKDKSAADQAMMLHSLGVLSLKDLIILTSCAPGVVEREEAMARCLSVVRGEHAEVWRGVIGRLRAEGVAITFANVSAALALDGVRIVSRVSGTVAGEEACVGEDGGDDGEAACGGDGVEMEVWSESGSAEPEGAEEPGSVDWSAGSVSEEVLKEHSTVTRGVCLLDGGRRAVTTDDAGELLLWDMRGGSGGGSGVGGAGGGGAAPGSAGRPAAAAAGGGGAMLVRRVKAHSTYTHGLCVCPDESLIATGSHDGSVKLWTAEGEAVRTLREAPSGTTHVTSACFSADGRRVLAAAYQEKALLELDVLGGGVLRTIPAGVELMCVDASRDGKWVVTSDSGGHVKIWDAKSLAVVATLDGSGSSSIYGVCFSPDSSCVAATSKNKHLRVWRVSDWSKQLDIEAHSLQAYQVCWSADSKQIVTSGYDKAVKVWEASSGRLLKALLGHTHHAWGVAMSPDGRLIASCSYDKTVRLWRHKA